MIIDFSEYNNKQNKFIYDNCLSVLSFLEINYKKINKILNSEYEEKENCFLSSFDAKKYSKFDFSLKISFGFRISISEETFLKLKQDLLYFNIKNYFGKKNNISFFLFKILYFYNRKRFDTMLPVAVKIINNKFVCDLEKSKELLKKEYQVACETVNKYMKNKKIK